MSCCATSPKLDVEPLSHRILSSLEDLEAHRGEWDRLIDEAYGGNPFLLLDWHLNWLRVFAPNFRYVRIGTGTEALGYFPLVLRKERFHGHTVRILGYAGNSYCPINCPILKPGAGVQATEYLVARVLPQLPWDTFFGRDLPEELPGLEEMVSALERHGYRPHREPGEANLIGEDLGPDSEAYFRSRKSKVRRDANACARKLTTLGKSTFRMVSSDASDAEFAAYHDVYGRTWKQREHPSFHSRLMATAARGGWLRLGFLYLDNCPIAVQLWLFRHRRGYILRTAFDEAYRPFSVGTLLTWRMIERLMDEEGMNFFDYLKGDEPYKTYWTDTRRQRYSLFAFARSPKGRWLHFLDQRVLPWVRRHRALDWGKRKLAALITSRFGFRPAPT